LQQRAVGRPTFPMELAAPAPLSISRCLSVGGVNPARGLEQAHGRFTFGERQGPRAAHPTPFGTLRPADRCPYRCRHVMTHTTGRTNAHTCGHGSHAADGRRHNGTTWPVPASPERTRERCEFLRREVYSSSGCRERGRQTETTDGAVVSSVSARACMRARDRERECTQAQPSAASSPSLFSSSTRVQAARLDIVRVVQTCYVTAYVLRYRDACAHVVGCRRTVNVCDDSDRETSASRRLIRDESDASFFMIRTVDQFSFPRTAFRVSREADAEG